MNDLSARLTALPDEVRAYILAELCQHLMAAQDFNALQGLLSSLEFLAARCASNGLSDAIRDYDAARASLGASWKEESAAAQLAHFLSRRSHLIRIDPTLIWQEAHNAVEGIVRNAAMEHSRKLEIQPWLRKLSAAVSDHHSGQVISMAFWGNERILAVSTSAREVWVWRDTPAPHCYRLKP